MQNEALFRDKPVWSAIFSMAIPSVFTILVMIVYNMADLFFIGRLGDTAQVGAISIVGPVFSLLSAVSTMIGVGGCATIRECEGTGKFAFKSAADIALGKPGEPVRAVQGDTDKMLPGLNQIQLPFLIGGQGVFIDQIHQSVFDRGLLAGKHGRVPFNGLFHEAGHIFRQNLVAFPKRAIPALQISAADIVSRFIEQVDAQVL